LTDLKWSMSSTRTPAAVGAALRAEVRDNDLVGRFGGEEFVVLLPDLPRGAVERDDVRAIAERIRRRVGTLVIATGTPDGPCTIEGLTISVGAALHPADGPALEDVLAAADAALYRAKREGRNRVRMAGPVHIPAARRPTP
jgi:diguanylate cyclase (GGDEF)-like protein